MNDYFKKSNIEKKITEAEIIIYRKIYIVCTTVNYFTEQ